MFVHLRLHTEFSVVDGTTRIDDALAAAAADGQGALALTDLSNLFGAVKFYSAARSLGVKPILGVEVQVSGLLAAEGNTAAVHAAPLPRLLLLVQNRTGYLNLCALLSQAWSQSGLREAGVVRAEWLGAHSDGLIALAGAQAGPVGQLLLRGDEAGASAVALRLAQCFAHAFYIEVQRAGRADDEAHLRAACALAARLKLPVVATHPVQFLRADDYEAHEARVCIADGEVLGNPRRVRRFTPQQYFSTAAEMIANFADLPAAVANSVEIAKRCNLSLELGRARLPDYPTPILPSGEPMPMETYFAQACQAGLDERLAQLYPNAPQRAEQTPRYQERLAFEINTILKMGFPGYFLIVSDFILWAKANGCPVGPGRGSGAGSLVAYALKITDLDPLTYKLLFERFLNPERVSMPDFDVDFCQGNRDRVIEYVKGKYGRDAVSQIATFGTMAARAAIRDVGRVLDMSYTFCDGISKLVPNKPGQHITIEGAMKAEPQLAARFEQEDEVRTLLGLAQKLEGLTRNVGMHAGGVLIAPGRLTDFCPLYQQPGSDAAVSQFDKDDVEAIGLVKFDFLGLATLTILELAKDMMRQRHAHLADFAFEGVPLDDAATYKLFADGLTEAVFQFESRGMQGMLRDAKPTRLEDLIALNALYRPGPMDLIPSFVARKHGREQVEYPHPLVESVLAETYGIMVYQEQVMQTAQVLGGYSLGGADLLRRAMGKKKPEEMAKHRVIFREGAAKNGIGEQKADEVFDLMEKFAGYGFNKSHAAAYSLLAYHTAWLKVHHTAEFFCANMTVEMDNTDKLKVLFEDATKHFGLQFEPPDVNRGGYRFAPVSDKLIRYGLGAIKGTGEQAIEAVVREREAQGPYLSLFDFCRRVDRSRVNKRTVDALIKAGAFDLLQRNRAAMSASLDVAFDYAQAAEANAAQVGLFDLVADNSSGASFEEPALASALPWGVREQLTFEKAALGFYLSGHLFDEAAAEVRQIVRRPLQELLAGGDSRESQLAAGIVSDLRIINGQRGKVALFKLDDGSTSVEATADEALINASRHVLKDDALVIATVRVQPDRFSGGHRLNVQALWDLPAARCRFGKYLRVAVNGAEPDIAGLLKRHPALREATEHGDVLRGLPVRVQLSRMGYSAEVALSDEWRFYPTDAALADWRGQAHSGLAQVVYTSGRAADMALS